MIPPHLFKFEPEVAPHKKKSPKRKRFPVQCRIKFGDTWQGWQAFKNYETEKKREQALVDLRKSHKNIGWEFRAKPAGKKEKEAL